METRKSVAIIGSGPAALMVADVVSAQGYKVQVFEKRKGSGRKLLIAGSSGLNITNDLPSSDFIKHYSGSQELWKRVLSDFSAHDWIQFIESLNIKTFKGTSARYFVEGMKGSKFLRSWLNRLEQQGVVFHFDHECTGFEVNQESGKITLQFTRASTPISFDSDVVCFCLGGGSYEPQETPLRWPHFFKEKNLGFDEFKPSNVGYQVEWTPTFIAEADGLPLKNIQLTSSRGSRKGDIVITRYGMEGTPVYFAGEVGTVRIDLKPDLSLDQILKKLKDVKENLSPMRRVTKQLNLCPAALALIFHMAPKSALKDINSIAQLIKEFPVSFHHTQPLTESISSQGGLHLSELDKNWMFLKYPGVFAAGEMLNWDAPTGGFLIQGCVSQGYGAGHGILEYLKNLKKLESF
jgi:uncharacterized flavoprotein (TIGR03862 family)